MTDQRKLDAFDRRFPRSDIGALMRDPESQVATMLLDGWLQEGVLHWVQGPPEEGKSWWIIWAIAQVLAGDGRVLLADEELGTRRVAERLAAFGVPPDVVDRQLHHLDFPSLTITDAALWGEFVDHAQFDLAVFETGTDFIAIAGVPENSGEGVTAWIKDFPERVARAGAAVIVSDHVGKSGDSGGFAVGSRAKKAKSKIVYEFSCIQRFGRNEVGRVEVTTFKNTDDAAGVGLTGSTRVLRMGGQDDGAVFIVQDLTVEEQRKAKRESVEADKEFKRFVIDYLLNSPKVYVGSDAVIKAVRDAGQKGETKRWRDKLKEYAESPVEPVSRDAQRGFFHRDRVEVKAS